jgi:ABC-type nickel/cobalt efflux system permease component RcnA
MAQPPSRTGETTAVSGRATGLVGVTILAICLFAAAFRLQPMAIFGEASWAQAWQSVLTGQRRLLTDMRSAVASIRGGDTWMGSAGLVSIAFAYGVLHAAGPGHGKTVITSYALASNETIRRSIGVSFMAALVQACSAIALVFVGLMMFSTTARSLGPLEARLEMVSGGLIVCLGLYLLVARGRHILQSQSNDLQARGSPAPRAIDCSCDHAHFVHPGDIGGVWSWRSAWLLALSVGIRPCTGAMLLLIFARSQGMVWAGLLGTFAMALGTAATVSVLAMAAIGSRKLAMRASRPAPVWSGVLVNVIVLAAGLILVGLGAAMALTLPVRRPF